MKKMRTMFLILACMMALTGCLDNFTSGTPAPSEPGLPGETTQPVEESPMPAMVIQVGEKRFTATLYDNASARALLERLPLTLRMDELNGNEKFYFFSEKLPTDSQAVGAVSAGDLMLYGSDCLVLFYESFSTSYSYTRLGSIDDVTGLAGALGGGSVEVAFLIDG